MRAHHLWSPASQTSSQIVHGVGWSTLRLIRILAWACPCFYVSLPQESPEVLSIDAVGSVWCCLKLFKVVPRARTCPASLMRNKRGNITVKKTMHALFSTHWWFSSVHFLLRVFTPGCHVTLSPVPFRIAFYLKVVDCRGLISSLVLLRQGLR